VAESLYFETVHMITEDWPLGDSEKVFKAGERLLMVRERSRNLYSKVTCMAHGVS